VLKINWLQRYAAARSNKNPGFVGQRIGSGFIREGGELREVTAELGVAFLWGSVMVGSGLLVEASTG